MFRRFAAHASEDENKSLPEQQVSSLRALCLHGRHALRPLPLRPGSSSKKRRSSSNRPCASGPEHHKRPIQESGQSPRGQVVPQGVINPQSQPKTESNREIKTKKMAERVGFALGGL